MPIVIGKRWATDRELLKQLKSSLLRGLLGGIRPQPPSLKMISAALILKTQKLLLCVQKLGPSLLPLKSFGPFPMRQK
jgi:hypothetical protein